MNTAKIDLHLHLDGSIYLPWAYKTAIKRNVISQDVSFEEYYNSYYFTEYKTREEGFKRFDIPLAVLQDYEDLMEATYILIKTLDFQGLIYAEIRFAPSLHTLKGMSQLDAIKAVMDGVKKAKSECRIEIGIIACMMHRGENALCNMDSNFETIEVVRETIGDIVVGLDLAGFENNGDFKLYAPLFEKAREYHIPYTIHAGEMGMGEHVHDALMMKAHRIGHGVNCVNNDKWLKEVVDSKITLEVCVGSNVNKDRNYANHPVRKLIEAGVKVTLNTDNMMFARTTLQNEHNQLMAIGLSKEDIRKCTLNAIDAAFCKEEIKKKLYQLI